jgi:urease accessory protein
LRIATVLRRFCIWTSGLGLLNVDEADGEHAAPFAKAKEQHMKKIALSVLGLAAMAHSAEAHTGLGHVHGVVSGFIHPLMGADHLLAMVAVGLFAATLGGRALWAVPLSFMAMMMIGGVVGMMGGSVPFVEAAIALSVIVLGTAAALQWKLHVSAAAALAGVFALFHGVAHGAEMPSAASGLAYGLGFVVATGLLHSIGVLVGLNIHRLARISGAAIALAGFGIAAGVI